MKIERRGKQVPPMGDTRLIDEPFIAYLPSLARDLGSPIRAIVMQTLWFARNRSTGLTEMSYTDMADWTGIPERTLRTHCKWLRDNGHLEAERKSTLDSTNVWRVTLRPPEVAESATPSDGEGEDRQEGSGAVAGSAVSGRPDRPPLDVAESATPLYEEEEPLNQEDAAAVSTEGEQQQPELEREELLVVPCDNDEPHPAHTWWTEAAPEGGYQYQRQCEGVTVEEIAQAEADIAEAKAAAAEDEPAETMEEAVATIAETLGGTVVADTASHGETPNAAEEAAQSPAPGYPAGVAGAFPAHDPDGPRAQHHGGSRYTVSDDPRKQQPFPAVAYRNLVQWWAPTQQEGEAWEAAWQAADMATARSVEGDQFYYDPESHLMIYLSRCKAENRRPRGDLWLRFFVEDRAKHVQTLRQQREQAERRAEDPQQREDRTNSSLPPADWGPPEEPPFPDDQQEG